MLKWIRRWHWLQNVCPAEKQSWWGRRFAQAEVAWENQGRLSSGGDAVSRKTSLYVVKTHTFRDWAVVEGEWFVGPWGWLKNRARLASQAQGPLLPESRKKDKEEFSQRKDMTSWVWQLKRSAKNRDNIKWEYRPMKLGGFRKERAYCRLHKGREEDFSWPLDTQRLQSGL